MYKNIFSRIDYQICARAQSGLVLILTLIILAIMSLAAVGLSRSVDTANLSIGNIAFRQGSVVAGDRAVKAAMANFTIATSGWLATSSNTEGTVTTSYPSLGYYSTIQTETKGVPDPLINASCTTATTPYCVVISDTQTQESIRYIIERLCVSGTTQATQAGCETWNFNAAGGSQDDNVKAQTKTTPLFRVTARIDGPRNTVSYVQAVFRP